MLNQQSESRCSAEPLFFDTETCGLHGICVLIQYAYGDGEVILHNVWKEPISDTIRLIEDFTNNTGGIVGFNLSFDWFHLNKLYNVFSLFPDHRACPEDHIEELASLERQARDGLCLKPVSACDLMIHARRGPYQNLMARDDIKIKRIPRVMAERLRDELDKRIKLKDIFFAKNKRAKQSHWEIRDIDGVPDFVNLALKFNPSSALKALAVDALGLDPYDTMLFQDVMLSEKITPQTPGFAPIGGWKEFIQFHVNHWEYNSIARRYATKDVEITRGLYQYFGSPEPGDVDSNLACMVGAVRWHGYRVDVPMLKELRKKAVEVMNSAPRAAEASRRWICEVLPEAERVILDKSTGAEILEEIAKWEDLPEAAERARAILDARHAEKEVDLYTKLISAERLHAAYNITGTKSNRMSGTGGLNATGIKREKYVKKCFPLAFPGFKLCGGDFKSFEVTIVDAVYADPVLHEELKSGKKIHALFGMGLFPGMSYEEIKNSEGTSDDKYTKSKSGFFAVIYFGNEFTLEKRIGIPVAIGEEAFKQFCKKYPKFGSERGKYALMFCSMQQPNGLGTAVEWHEPHDYIESMFGFKRYFTLENQICKALFELAQDVPEDWRKIKVKVSRSAGRIQTASGATQSALYGAAFALQAANMRAAGNHVIQSPGATITKELQHEIWGLQPSGVSDWIVLPMNIHDELNVPTREGYEKAVNEIVNDFIERMKEKIPLIGIDWKTNMETWADK